MAKRPRPEKSVTVVRQRHSGDCAVAALAGYLSLSYGDVAAVARRQVPDYRKQGMYSEDMASIARTLGHTLKRTEAYSLLDAVGIADMNFKSRRRGHFAVLNRGLILDPIGSTAEPVDLYLKRERASIVALYVLKD